MSKLNREYKSCKKDTYKAQPEVGTNTTRKEWTRRNKGGEYFKKRE